MTRSYLSVANVAHLLGCDQRTVLAWIRAGELQALNVATRPKGKPRWKIPQDAWEAFQRSRSNQATIPAKAPTRRRKRQQDDVIQFYPE